MKKKAEIAIAALAVMFICFALGYFTGRRSVPSGVSILPGTVVVTPAEVSADDSAIAAATESVPTPKPETPSPDAADTPSPPVEAPEAPTATPQSEPDTPTPEMSDAPAAEPHYTDDGLLRINYATQKELETLPGIGEVLASRIVEYREKNGSFSRLSTLKAINGIGDARYNAIKDLVTVE